MALSRRTLETYHEVSGKSWKAIAQDLGVGDRYLRKVRAGEDEGRERKGIPTLERVDRLLSSHRTQTAREVIDRMARDLGSKRAVATELGVSDAYLRKIARGERAGIPTVERLFQAAVDRGLTRDIGSLAAHTEALIHDRVGRTVSEMFEGFRGKNKTDIDKMVRGLMLREGLEIGGDEEDDIWDIARELYSKHEA